MTTKSSVPANSAKQKLLIRIAAAQRQADAAKRTVKLAKLNLRLAKQKFKDAKRAAKKLRKTVKSLKAELEVCTKKASPRTAVARKRVVRRRITVTPPEPTPVAEVATPGLSENAPPVIPGQ